MKLSEIAAGQAYPVAKAPGQIAVKFRYRYFVGRELRKQGAVFYIDPSSLESLIEDIRDSYGSTGYLSYTLFEYHTDAVSGVTLKVPRWYRISGDVKAYQDDLRRTGNYRPVVVQTKPDYI